MIKIIFGGTVGVLIAALIGIILVQSPDQTYQQRSQSPVPFMLILVAIGGFTGSAIASPLPDTKGE